MSQHAPLSLQASIDINPLVSNDEFVTKVAEKLETATVGKAAELIAGKVADGVDLKEQITNVLKDRTTILSDLATQVIW